MARKTYRTEDFDLSETMDKLMDILGGYPEIDLAKETLELIFQYQKEFAHLHQTPVELKLKAMEIYEKLAQSFLEQEDVVQGIKKSQVLGSQDPVASILDKAYEGTEKILDRLTEDEDALEPMVEKIEGLSSAMGDRIGKLLERPEIAKKDKKRLEALGQAISQYTNSK